MLKNRFSPSVLLLPALFTLALAVYASRSGDSSSPTPTDTDQVFSLSTVSSLKEGTIYQSTLVGTATYHDHVADVTYTYDITGSILVANKASSIVDGALLTPRQVHMTIDIDGTEDSGLTTTYFDEDGYIVKQTLLEPPVSCKPLSSDKFPGSVKINAFGQLSTLLCSDNETQTRTWHTADGQNGHLLLIENAESSDGPSSQTTYKLNTGGEIISAEFSASFNDFVIKLKSK